MLPNPSQTVNKKNKKTACFFLLNCGFSAEKKFYREHLLTFWELGFYCRGEEVFHENHVRFGAWGLWKRNFRRPNNHCAREIIFKSGAKKNCANKLVLFLGFDQFQGAFLITFFLTRGLALFQQFVDDAGFWIARGKTSRLPNQWKMTVPLDPCKKHQFELPVDCNNVEMFPSSPHDRDVMPKTRGVDVTDACGTTSFQKKRPKIRSNLTW